jgi:hypothetical protein
MRVDAWSIGYALFIGLQIYRCISPELMTTDVFEHVDTLKAGLYDPE